MPTNHTDASNQPDTGPNSDAPSGTTASLPPGHIPIDLPEDFVPRSRRKAADPGIYPPEEDEEGAGAGGPVPFSVPPPSWDCPEEWAARHVQAQTSDSYTVPTLDIAPPGVRADCMMNFYTKLTEEGVPQVCFTLAWLDRARNMFMADHQSASSDFVRVDADASAGAGGSPEPWLWDPDPAARARAQEEAPSRMARMATGPFRAHVTHDPPSVDSQAVSLAMFQVIGLYERLKAGGIEHGLGEAMAEGVREAALEREAAGEAAAGESADVAARESVSGGGSAPAGKPESRPNTKPKTMGTGGHEGAQRGAQGGAHEAAPKASGTRTTFFDVLSSASHAE